MYDYLNPKIIREIANSDKVFDPNSYFIGSIGDVLLETEYQKEKVTANAYELKMQALCKENDHYHIQELTVNELKENMFKESTEEIELDEEICRIDVPPHYSINYATLKANESFNFWDSDIVLKMKNWHNG